MTTVYSVTKPDILADPSYSPDGEHIVFVELIGVQWRVSTITTDVSPAHEVLITSNNPLAEPSFSADGLYIVYAEQTSPVSGPEPYGQWALKYFQYGTTDVIEILGDGNANMHPAWATPTQIVFQTWDYGVSTEFSLRMVDLAGQGLTDLGEGEYPRVVSI